MTGPSTPEDGNVDGTRAAEITSWAAEMTYEFGQDERPSEAVVEATAALTGDA